MRTRPTRSIGSMEGSPPRRATALAVILLASLLLAAAGPALAEDDEGEPVSAPERILMTGLDMTIIRPLAAFRAGVGSVLLVPATILASPGCLVNLVNGTDCRPIFEEPYEVLVGEPADYAFNRKMGDLEAE